MPGNALFNTDIQDLDLSKFDSVEQKFSAIQNYLFLHLENLRYTLRNLNPKDNFNQQELSKWIQEILAMSSGVQTVAPVLTFGAGDGRGNALGVMYEDLDDGAVMDTTADGNVSQTRLDGSEHVSPSLTFEEEDASGDGTAVFEKNTEEDTMDMSYTNADGDSSAIRTEEYADAKHRRPVKLDFSGLADGGSTFTVKWDGDEDEQLYIVIKDSQGRIERIIAQDFQETEVMRNDEQV